MCEFCPHAVIMSFKDSMLAVLHLGSNQALFPFPLPLVLPEPPSGPETAKYPHISNKTPPIRSLHGKLSAIPSKCDPVWWSMDRYITWLCALTLMAGCVWL